MKLELGPSEDLLELAQAEAGFNAGVTPNLMHARCKQSLNSESELVQVRIV